MIISLLAALDLEGGIGKDGRIPWHLSADLKLFKRLTMGHHILMGRKTYESIGCALPGRVNIVMTTDKKWSASNVLVFDELENAIEYARSTGEDELFVIGGGNIFAQTLDLAQRIYLTQVQTTAGCTVFFPKLEHGRWKIIEVGSHPKDEKNDHSFIFFLLEKIAYTCT